MAKTAMRGFCFKGPRQVPIDWHKRRGTVQNTPHTGGGCIVIRWDGLLAGDSWPKGAIEKDE
jgi:hypothetical protein